MADGPVGEEVGELVDDVDVDDDDDDAGADEQVPNSP